MKKISLCLLFVLCLFMSGCGSKEEKVVKTLNDFQVACTNNGFTVNDNMTNYQNISYITGSMVGTLEDITIEMVTYDTEESAKKTQDKHIDTFKTMKSSGTIVNKEKGKNYYKYDMISNGYYMVSVRVDNTLVFSKTKIDGKDKIVSILNELNY